MPRLLALILLAGAGVSCRHAPPVLQQPLFPMAPAWTTPLPAVAEGPLAVEGGFVYVTARDGSARSIDLASGAVRWEVADRPGVVAAAGGLVVIRDPAGTVWSLAPRTGATRWTAGSGVAGALPPVINKDGVLVAGEGLALLDATRGETRWSVPEVRVTTPPVVSGALVLVTEGDGALRARDLSTGALRWTYATPRPLAAPPVVDDRGRVLLGTTDRRFVSLDLEDGDENWSWRVGADVQAPPALSGELVLFTNHEDVVYALRRGNGHLAWRAALPSRPLSGPLLHGDSVLVACYGARPGETFLIGFQARTGVREGDLKAPGEVRSAPVIAGEVVVLALRERAVAALRLGSAPNP